MSWTQYFKNRIASDESFPVLEVLKKPCGDCAVTCGFYSEISHALSKQNEEVKLKMSQKWFCHSHTSKACKGNWDFQYPEANI